MPTQSVLLVEDDHFQRRSVETALRDAGYEVTSVSTESEFRSRFEAIAANPPDVAVLDGMVRWTELSRNMIPSPPEVRDSPQRAGIRCAAQLARDSRTSSVRIIMYSVWAFEDLGADNSTRLPEGVSWIAKERSVDNLLLALAKPELAVA